MKKCVFAGTFDPFTLGHEKIVEKALLYYDKVYVVIGVNPEKKPFFSVEERLGFIRECFKNDDRVEVDFNSGFTVDFLKENGVTDYVRGIRNDADVKYEKADEELNRKLYPELNYVYIRCSKDSENVSSTLVKEKLYKGESVSGLLPEKSEKLVINAFNDKIKNLK